MIALPTPHGTLFLLATAASIGVAYVNVGLGSALAAAFFTGVAAASFLTAQFSLFGIRVEREDMADAVCGSHANFPPTQHLSRARGWSFPKKAGSSRTGGSAQPFPHRAHRKQSS